jgi:AraC-like DNA-binding protein
LDARITHKTPEGMDYHTRLILIEIYSNSRQPAVNRTAEKIAAWIEANCHTAITELQIASQFGYNADYLNRLFKSSFSKTIKQYINDKRIEHIKGLMLRGDLPLKEIAIQSGFSEYKYFLKFFKYHEKITPTEFYKQYTKIHINSR